jgi:hypothetical protein
MEKHRERKPRCQSGSPILKVNSACRGKIQCRISNTEPQNDEVYPSAFDIPWSLFCGSLSVFCAIGETIWPDELLVCAFGTSHLKRDRVQNLSFPVDHGKQILPSLRFPGHPRGCRTQSLSIQDPPVILHPFTCRK